MKLGARIVKTGVAIVLALFIAELLGLPNPVFAGIAAIFAIQPSIYRSYLTIIEQIQGNVIGAVIAIIFRSHIRTSARYHWARRRHHYFDYD